MKIYPNEESRFEEIKQRTLKSDENAFITEVRYTHVRQSDVDWLINEIDTLRANLDIAVKFIEARKLELCAENCFGEAKLYGDALAQIQVGAPKDG